MSYCAYHFFYVILQAIWNDHFLFNLLYTMKVKNIMSQLAAKHPGEAEYLQAVQEVLESIEEVYNQHPEFEEAKIVE